MHLLWGGMAWPTLMLLSKIQTIKKHTSRILICFVLKHSFQHETSITEYRIKHASKQKNIQTEILICCLPNIQTEILICFVSNDFYRNTHLFCNKQAKKHTSRYT